MNAKTFYDSIRRDLFGGKLTPDEVENIEAILAEYTRRKINNVCALSYIFATVYHETGKEMKPIKEYDRGGNRDYAKKLKMGGGPGKRIPYNFPDKIYYGRGHVQVTWYENYAALTRAAKAEGKSWDFLSAPELLLTIKPSIWATFHGMTTGMFTSKKLSTYFTDDRYDYYNARRIINGTDAAQKIAGYAELFYKALTAK